MNTSSSGQSINGTYTDALGMLQRGEHDMILSDTAITAARARYFTFSVPFSWEKIVVLVRRQRATSVRFDNLNANIDVRVYGLTIVLLAFLILLFVLQDRFVNFRAHIDTWKIVHLSMPGCCTERLTNDIGWTKKVIIISISFMIMMLTSYYQCTQLSAFLLPPKVTIPDNIDHLEPEMLNGHIKTAFMTLNGSLETDLYTGTNRLAKMLQKIWHHHPPNHILETWSNAEAIRSNKTMIIGMMSNVFAILRYIDPYTCDEYELITLEEMPPRMMGIVFRPNYQQIQRINMVIEERRNWVRRLIDENQVHAICREKIFHTSNQEISQKPLDVHTLSGVFVTYVCAICIAFCAFLVEILWMRFTKRGKRHIYIDDYVGENAYKEYLILLDMIASKT